MKKSLFFFFLLLFLSFAPLLRPGPPSRAAPDRRFRPPLHTATMRAAGAPPLPLQPPASPASRLQPPPRTGALPFFSPAPAALHLALFLFPARLWPNARPTPAALAQIGAAYTKAGFSGEHTPRCVVPSTTVRFGRTVNVADPSLWHNEEELREVLIDFLFEVRPETSPSPRAGPPDAPHHNPPLAAAAAQADRQGTRATHRGGGGHADAGAVPRGPGRRPLPPLSGVCAQARPPPRPSRLLPVRLPCYFRSAHPPSLHPAHLPSRPLGPRIARRPPPWAL